jgi:DNA-directed RNA polymerase subunit RPC12/RpoP
MEAAMTLAVFDARKGQIAWTADEVVGYKCGCGGDEELILSIYADMPTECPECHARLYYKQRIEIMQVDDDA